MHEIKTVIYPETTFSQLESVVDKKITDAIDKLRKHEAEYNELRRLDIEGDDASNIVASWEIVTELSWVLAIVLIFVTIICCSLFIKSLITVSIVSIVGLIWAIIASLMLRKARNRESELYTAECDKRTEFWHHFCNIFGYDYEPKCVSVDFNELLRYSVDSHDFEYLIQMVQKDKWMLLSPELDASRMQYVDALQVLDRIKGYNGSIVLTSLRDGKLHIESSIGNCPVHEYSISYESLNEAEKTDQFLLSITKNLESKNCLNFSYLDECIKPYLV